MLDPRGDVMAFAGLPSPLRVAVPCPDHRVYNSMRISSVASNRQRTHGAWRPAAGHSCQRPAAAISSQQHEPHQQQHIAASAALPVQVYWTVLLASHSRGGMKPFASRCGGAEAIHSEGTEKSSSQPSLLPSLHHAAGNDFGQAIISVQFRTGAQTALCVHVFRNSTPIQSAATDVAATLLDPSVCSSNNGRQWSGCINRDSRRDTDDFRDNAKQLPDSSALLRGSEKGILQGVLQ